MTDPNPGPPRGAAGPPPTQAGPPQQGAGISQGGPPPVVGLTTVEQLRPRLQEMLTRMFGNVVVTPQNAFTIQAGSSRVFVTADQMNEAHTVVSVFAITNLDIKPSPAFFEWIAKNGDVATFGHLAAIPREGGTFDVFLSHRLLGTYIDYPELEGAIYIVGRTADQIDAEIKSKFGGRTFHEEVEQAAEADPSPDPGYL